MNEFYSCVSSVIYLFFLFPGEPLVVLIQGVPHNRLQVVFKNCAHLIQDVIAAQFLTVHDDPALLGSRAHLLVNYILQLRPYLLRGSHRAADELSLEALTRLFAPGVRCPEECGHHSLVTVVVELRRTEVDRCLPNCLWNVVSRLSGKFAKRISFFFWRLD